MKTKEYPNLKEAIESLTEKDKNYIFIRHTINHGEPIRPHYHPKANEFLIVDNGVFDIWLDRDSKILVPNGKVIVVVFPKGQRHSLKTINSTPVSYFVFRDRKDETIYCEEARNNRQLPTVF